MDDNTPEELRTGPSTQRLGSLREILWLQWNQMDAAWQSHKPADGNVDTDVLAKLGATVEATRVAIAHVLRISGDAIRVEVEWRPTAAFDPTLACYTALSDFHCRVMNSAHQNSIHSRRSPNPGGAGKRTNYTSSSGPLRHITRKVTTRDTNATADNVCNKNVEASVIERRPRPLTGWL